MLAEAEKFKEEDEAEGLRVSAKNGLESYAYSLRNTLSRRQGRREARRLRQGDAYCRDRQDCRLARREPAGYPGGVRGAPEGARGHCQPHHDEVLRRWWRSWRWCCPAASPAVLLVASLVPVVPVPATTTVPPSRRLTKRSILSRFPSLFSSLIRALRLRTYDHGHFKIFYLEPDRI